MFYSVLYMWNNDPLNNPQKAPEAEIALFPGKNSKYYNKDASQHQVLSVSVLMKYALLTTPQTASNR